MEFPEPPDGFSAAVRLHEAGDLDGAEVAYRSILGRRPGHVDSLHLLGVLAHQRGRHEEAEGEIRRAIGLVPGRADYRNNLGAVLRALGRPGEAEAAYREALRLAPAYPDALASLGAVLHDLGRADEARSAVESALRLAPDHADATFGLANLLHDRGEFVQAVSWYRRAHALRPGRADVLRNLGIALAASGDLGGALDAHRRAVEVAPADPSTLAALGEALERFDRLEEAAEAYAAASRLRPLDRFWPIRIAGLCPSVSLSVAAIDRYRIGLEAVLDAHRGGLALGPDRVIDARCLPSFALAHHGRCDRDLRSRFAALFRDVDPGRRPPPGEGLPHLGFVVPRHSEWGFARGMAGIVDRLDPGQFRVSVFGTELGMATLRAAIQRPGVDFVALPHRLPEAAGLVAEARCDVLYHWQVDLDPLGYFLPFARPAPIQCTSWGTHATSGIPAIDYYLSCEWLDPPGSEAHYSEELVRLATLPTFQWPVVHPSPPAVRREFGLPEGSPLYACLQRTAKLHPDFDPILAGILRRDPAGLVLLQDPETPRAGERLRGRIAAAMPDVFDRVLFLPRRSRVEYLRLLSLVDVALDPLHYGSGLTAYDIFGLGIPLVTWPGLLQVGRYAEGCYRRMGLKGASVDSWGEYVESATRLGMDPEHRAAASARIASAAPALFEDPLAVSEHVAFFERAAARAREGGGSSASLPAIPGVGFCCHSVDP